MATQKETAAAEPSATRVRKFQVFQRIVLKRNQVAFHEQNPRSIDKHSFKRLREFVRKNGLVNALVANRRTEANGFPPDQNGRIVLIGGHQRASAMDEIVDYPAAGEAANYDLPIDLVELSPGKEKAMLVALNNPGLQGTWDYDLLEQVLADPDVDAGETGFTRADLGMMFDQGILDGIFGEEAATQAAVEAPVIDQLQEIREVGAAAEKSAKQEAAANESQLELLRERREKYKERSNDANEAEFLVVFVGETAEQVDRFLVDMQLPVDQRYHPLSHLVDQIASIREGK